MFKDIQRSKELMNDFNGKHADTIPIEMNVSVCTTGAWPSNAVSTCKVPEDLRPAADLYKKFYSGLHSGRKLDFRMDLGKAEVQVYFNQREKKILVVTTYQMMALLLFNTKKVLTFKEMLDMTGIPRKELAWHVLSLAHPKVKVLRKDPSSKRIEDDHRFGINPKFKNARSRVCIPLMTKPQEEDPGAEQRRQILRLRQHQMDAAIVRIMKARKTQVHNDLVQEVTRQLNNRFTPTPNDSHGRGGNMGHRQLHDIRMKQMWDVAADIMRNEGAPITVLKIRALFPGEKPRRKDLNYLLYKEQQKGNVIKHENGIKVKW